jgi:hypothetical protein
MNVNLIPTSTLIGEAVIVGIYSFIIFSAFSSLPIFWIGFLKHFLGYFLGLHELYCLHYGKKIKPVAIIFFIWECILEGIGFSILFYIFMNPFITGFVFHILSEYTGIHKLFIKYRCK